MTKFLNVEKRKKDFLRETTLSEFFFSTLDIINTYIPFFIRSVSVPNHVKNKE